MKKVSQDTVAEVLAELETLGTEQNRKIYGRHGAVGPRFGVSYAHMDKLTKRLRGRPDLAAPLWESGFLEARILATRLLAPIPENETVLQQWVAQCRDSAIACALGDAVARIPDASEFCWALGRLAGEWEQGTGFNGLSVLATRGKLDGGIAAQVLRYIEHAIHERPNYARYAMNGALIAIGACLPELTERALEIAAKIGKVEVDHGETGCKTPDAAAYIQKTLAYQAAKAAKRSGADYSRRGA